MHLILDSLHLGDMLMLKNVYEGCLLHEDNKSYIIINQIQPY